MRNNRILPALAVAGALAFGVAACGGDDDELRPAALRELRLAAAS